MQEDPTAKGALGEEPAAAGEPEFHEEEARPREGFRRQWQLRLYLRILALGLLVAYGIAFVLENNREISVHFVLATARVSLIWLILLSVALGLFVGVLLSQLYRRRRRGD